MQMAVARAASMPVGANLGESQRSMSQSDQSSLRLPLLTFFLGTAVGGIAGAVVGSLLSGHLASLVSGMLGIVERKSGKDQEPPFDLLLQ